MKIKVPVTAAMFFCFLPCRNSAPNRPVTPVESSVDFLFDQTESAAILKIKESMQEEAKRFETDSDHPDYFIQ
ncbi:hypothetical protein OUZ56_021998 [Daphnia magna]|uniref:Uncharacterized protein n=1 Tax=Daphnia magna TaxID=35525 RepID=A0ABR0AV68_9CRUS|nr:hypothetical protein OUZ56_021998 [Daphnia magna]